MPTIEIDVAASRDDFLNEAAEHVADFESALLELEQAPADRELLNRIFRAAHSLKGGSGSLGFKVIARFTHARKACSARCAKACLHWARR